MKKKTGHAWKFQSSPKTGTRSRLGTRNMGTFWRTFFLWFRSFFIVWVFRPGCFIQTTTEKHPGFQNLRTPFFSLYSVGVWVRGVFKINATSSLNFEVSRRLSDLLLTTLRPTWMENAVSFSTQRCYVSEFASVVKAFFHWWQSWFTISEKVPRAV